MQAEASKVIHQLFGARPSSRGGVLGAMPGNPNQADRVEAPSVRTGRLTLLTARARSHVRSP